MAIQTECTGCGTLLQVAEQHAGKKARCPQCGNIYNVPTGLASSPSIGSSDVTDKPLADQPLADQPSPEDQWWMRTGEGQLYGPISRQTLDVWVAEHRVAPRSEVRHGGSSRWQPAEQLYRQLRRHTAATQRTASSAPRGVEFELNDQGPIGAAATYGARRRVQPHRGGTVLTMAILGWVFCPIFAPLALWQARTEFRAIARGEVDPGGRSKLVAATVLSSIEVGVLVLAALLTVIVG